MQQHDHIMWCHFCGKQLTDLRSYTFDDPRHPRYGETRLGYWCECTPSAPVRLVA